MLSTKLKEAAGNGADATLYVDDVFSTWLYTGNGTTQTIANSIDLAGKGGMVWTKSRSAAYNNALQDTVRGRNNILFSNDTVANQAYSTSINSFNANGYTLGSETLTNQNGTTYVGWTFRKAAKFFDVVTYTGTGSARTIAHSLGVAPGMVIVKRTDTTGNWQVYHRSLTSAAYSIQLNLTDAQASAPTVWNSTAPTSSVFSVGTSADVNASGGTYVAYLYAHDTSSTGIIQCGSFTVSSSSDNTDVNLGFEPQWMLAKISTGEIDNWKIYDTMRGWVVRPGINSNIRLNPNTSTQQTSDSSFQPTSTGFTMLNSAVYPGAPVTYIYMAICMPNKPPTTGTQVFEPATRTGTGTTATVTSAVSPIDMLFSTNRDRVASSVNSFWDRLRGGGVYLNSNSTDAEISNNSVSGFDVQNGIIMQGGLITNGNSYPYVNYNFKRAPGFFDVVCYTGNGVTRTVAHNLTVVPELMIVKERSVASRWVVYHSVLGNTKYIALNESGSPVTSNMWNNTTPTNAVFSVGVVSEVNSNSETYVAYLFATLAGISKVGSYTGNGTSQNINCGFAAGARFFLVKATSTTGSWWVWDSARGITAGNDPALQLNSTAAEITTADAVDPYSPGITVNQEATCSINANGVSYIFLAVA